MIHRARHPMALGVAGRLVEIAHRRGALDAVSAALTRLGPSAGDAAILAFALSILNSENLR